MSTKEIIYAFFYLTVFASAMGTGIYFGFTNRHIAPMPFIIELLCIPIGLVLLNFDLFNRNIPKTFSKFYVHILGLTINTLVVVYIFYANFF